MPTDSITQMEKNWNNLVKANSDQGIGNEVLEIEETGDSLYWEFEVAATSSGKHYTGHVNYQACQDNSGDHKFCYAHVTLEKNGSDFPDKVNYWFEVDVSGVRPTISDGKLPSVKKAYKHTHKHISQFPFAKNSMIRLLQNIYA